jgi:hypothetical protein
MNQLLEKQQGEFRTKYDQIGKAIEGRAIRGLNNPRALPSRSDLRAIAGTLAVAQRIREKALQRDGDSVDDVWGAIADAVQAERRRKPAVRRQASRAGREPDDGAGPRGRQRRASRMTSRI